MSPYMHLSAALPVVLHSLFLVIAVNRNMGHSTAPEVARIRCSEVSNLFTMNAAFLRNALTLLTEKSSLYKIILF